MKKTIKPSATPVEYVMNGGTFSYECDKKVNEAVALNAVYGKCVDDYCTTLKKINTKNAWCSVAIEFSHSENETDETEFDVRLINDTAPDLVDLTMLFMGFICENKFKNVIVTGLRITDVAVTIEELGRS